MPELSPSDQIRLAQVTADMMRLLQLDDAWTAAAAATTAVSLAPGIFYAPLKTSHVWQIPFEVAQLPESSAARGSAEELAAEMKQVLQQMSNHHGFVAELPDLMGDALTQRFDALQWGAYGFSSQDRDDLRWLMLREGGVAGLAESAAEALSAYQAEIDAIDAQLGNIARAMPAEGDLSRKYRCGLGKALMLTGAGALPPAASAGAAAAFGAGALAAGIAVGATGGLLGVAIIVAGLLVIRSQRC
jgi:hypothetical protein